MLTLTDTASTVVKAVAAQSSATDSSGLRISRNEEGAPDFTVAVVPAPEPTDEIVEREGALVYLEQNAAVALTDKVLDAQVDDDGSVHFALGAQGA